MGNQLLDLFVINWSGKEHLGRCLRALSRTSYAPCRMTVLDPRREIDPISIKKEFPEIEVVTLKRGVRHREALNAALRMLRDDAVYVALMDSATEADGNWASALISAAGKSGRDSIPIPKILYGTDRRVIFSFGVRIGERGQAWESLSGKVDAPPLPEEHPVSPHWSAALFPRRVMDEVGLFAGGHGIHFDMIDYCLRASRVGIRCVRVPEAVAYHWNPVPIRESMVRSTHMISQASVMLDFYPLRVAVPALFALIRNSLAGREGEPLAGADLPDRLCRPKAYAGILKAVPRAALARMKGQPRQRLNCGVRPPAMMRKYQPLPVSEEELTNRVMMGVNDLSLGRGWFELKTEEHGGIPAISYRWMSKTGCVSLAVEGDGPHLLQLHLSNPFSSSRANALTVRIDGAPQGRRAVGDPGWRIHHLPVSARKGLIEIELEADCVYHEKITGEYADVSLRVSEIGIMAKNDPLLRESFTAVP